MATTNPDDPTVTSVCDDYTPPTGVAAPDCYEPDINVGPGINLYYFKTPFAATPKADSVAAKLNGTPANGTTPAVPADGIGPIIGEYTTGNSNTNTTRVNLRDIILPGKQDWNVKISNTSLAMREFARQTQNGGITGHFYVVDANGNWHGGQNGICPRADGGPAILQLRGKIPTGETDIQTIEGTISAFGKYDAKVIVSPVAAVY